MAIAVFVVMMFSAVRSESFMAGRVDGNRVYYSASNTYAVDSSFVYIGTFESDQTITAQNSQTNKSTRLLINEVFAKRYGTTNELVELFIAQWNKLPNRWHVTEPGPMKERIYEFRPTKFTGLSAFLESKGYTYTDVFHGGMMLGFGYNDTYTRYYFAVAKSTIPKDVTDNDGFLRTAFSNAVKLEQ